MLKKQAYLQTQVGNPEGDDKPNKKVIPVLFTVKSPRMIYVSVLRPSSLGS